LLFRGHESEDPVAYSIASLEEDDTLVDVAPVALPYILAAYGGTDTGMVRESNEDSFAVRGDLGVFMVADGLGGAAAGEVASQIAIEQVERAVEDADTTWPRDPAMHGPDSGPRRFIAGIHHANRSILRQARREQALRGMGTTFAGLLLLERRAIVAHVGDSRVYRLREGTLDRMTRDHTLANHLLDRGWLTPDEVDSHPKRHVITRAVGTHEMVEVDTRIVDLQPDDAFLVCSDGLHGLLDDAEIEEILSAHADPFVAVGILIDRANEKGGHDNVTAVVVRLGAVPG
jgi:PPM family protein phosphatase